MTTCNGKDGNRDVICRPGHTLFRAGDACTRFFSVLDGVVRVQSVSRSGREVVFYRVRRGEICMMTAAGLINSLPYRVDGVVEEEAHLHFLSAAAFHSKMAQDEGFRNFVLGAVTARLDTVVRVLQDVAFEAVGSRLAALLIARSSPDGVVHDTHEALALELGSVREVVSRRLKTFEQRGWVELARGRLRITDRHALQRLDC